MKWLRRSLIILSAMLLLIFIGAAWLVYSNAGASWALRSAAAFLDEPLHAAAVEGTLAGALTLRDFHYGDENSPLQVRAQRVFVDLVFEELWQRRLRLEAAEIEQLDVLLRPTQQQTSASSGGFNLQAPFDVVLDRLSVQQALLRSGEASQVQIHSLQLAGSWTEAGIAVAELRGELQSTAGTNDLHAAIDGSGTDTDGELQARFVVDKQVLELRSLRFMRTRDNVRMNAVIGLAAAQPQNSDAENQAAGEVRIAATVDLNRRPWRAAADVNWDVLQLPAEWLGQPLHSRGGQVHLAGNTEQFTAAGRLSLGPPGRIADIQLDLQGAPARIDIQQLRVTQQAGTLTAQGEVQLQPGLQWNVAASAASFDPGVFLAGWNGELNFEVNTQGSKTRQGLQGKLQLRDLHGMLRERPLSGVADLTLSSASVLTGSLNLQSGDSRVQVRGQRAESPEESLDATVQLEIASLGDWLPNASGAVRGQFMVQGEWPRLQVIGAARARNVNVAGVHVDAANLRADIDDLDAPGGLAQLDFQGVTSGQLSVQTGSLELAGNLQQHSIVLTTTGQPLSVQMEVRGNREGLDEHWNETVEKLVLDLDEFGEFSLQQAVTLTVAPQLLELDRFCIADDRGRICGSGRVNTQSRAIAAAIDARLPDIALLALATPQVANVQGSLNLQASIAGTVDAPEIDAQMRGENLAADVPRLGLKFREGNLEAVSRGEQIEIAGSIQSGDGRLAMDGTASRSGELRLQAQGERLLAADIPGAHVIATPSLRLVRDAQRMTLSGEVRIPTAQVDLQKLPRTGGAQSASPDVVIVDAETEREEASAQTPLHADITVILGEDVDLAGFGLQAQVDGRLAIHEAPGAPTTGSGELRVSGKYQAYGQDLSITQGSLLYASTPLDNPSLRITAVREVDDVTAGLRIAGTAQSPELAVFADPAMDDANALSYLVAGRPLESIGEGDGDALQSAARSLGTAAGGLLSKRLGNRLGIDTVGVEKSELIGGAAFTVGEYLSPRLYLSYGVGLFEPGDVITLRYRLSEDFSLRVERGSDENRAGIEYRIEK